jgi:hypothetical protein
LVISQIASLRATPKISSQWLECCTEQPTIITITITIRTLAHHYHHYPPLP